ncbi:MAG: hypothetical protein ACFFDN_31045, partial [Candidatus Hodarchaeota archaeon]
MKIINRHITFEDYSERNFTKKQQNILQEMKKIINWIRSKQQKSTSRVTLKKYTLIHNFKSLFFTNLKTNL